MIPRYSLPEMAALFSDEARLAMWLEVELLAVEGWAEIGAIPRPVADAVRARAPKVAPGLVAAVTDRERVTDHDVAAFVDVVQAGDRPARRIVAPLRAHVLRRGGHRAVRHLGARPPTCSSTRPAPWCRR